MGQQEIFDFLKEHRGKWFLAKEISKKSNLSVGSVRTCLKKLRKNYFIYSRKMSKYKANTFEYMYK